MDEAPARPWRHWLTAFAAGVALVIGAGLVSCDRASEPGGPDRRVTPSRTLELERAGFPTSGPVRVSLALAEPSADSEPLPVRLVSQPDHRILELAGVLEADRRAATIEVDPDYLQPGTYLVEVKTTERGVFPLRRYFIVVR